jgi:magnesium-transporting ATPase (P-type)
LKCVALGIVVSFEAHELDVMQRSPRAVDLPILDAFAIWRVIFVGLALLTLTLWAFFWMKQSGASDALARAVAVNALVIGQIFYLLNSRYKIGSSLSLKAHLDNKYLPLGIGAVVILQLLFTYAPRYRSSLILKPFHCAYGPGSCSEASRSSSWWKRRN